MQNIEETIENNQNLVEHLSNSEQMNIIRQLQSDINAENEELFLYKKHLEDEEYKNKKILFAVILILLLANIILFIHKIINH